MKKLTITLISFLGVIFSSKAQQQNAITTNKGHVWKVSKDGKTHYLGGSIHLLRDQDLPISNNYYEALSKAKKVIFESDMEAMRKPEFAQKMMQQGLLENGKTLKEYTSKKNYNTFETLCLNMGVPITQVSHLKPMMALIILSHVVYEKKGFKGTNGIENLITLEAKKQGIPIESIETPDEQLSFITNFDLKHTNQLFRKNFKDFEGADTIMVEMVNGLKSGDSKSIIPMFNSWRKDNPEIFKILVEQRNEDWLTKLPNIFSSTDPAFVVVGCGHLYGKEGLIPALTKMGYTLKQL